MIVADMQALRRRAAAYAGVWRALECSVLDDDGHVVLKARNAELAAYVQDVHNMFLPLANGWLMTQRALRDRAEMTKLLATEASHAEATCLSS